MNMEEGNELLESLVEQYKEHKTASAELVGKLDRLCQEGSLSVLPPFGHFVDNAAKDVVHVRDMHATMLHLLGIDHKKLSVKYQGLDMKLTGVEPARVVRDIIS